MSKNSDKTAFVDQLLQPFTDEQVAAVQSKIEALEAEIAERRNQIEGLAFVLKMDDIRKNGKKPRKSPEPRKVTKTERDSPLPEVDSPPSGVEVARQDKIVSYLRTHGPRKPASIAQDLEIPMGAVATTIHRLKQAGKLQQYGPGVGLPKAED